MQRRIFLLTTDERADFERRIEAALVVHAAWMTNLRDAVATGRSPLVVATVERDDVCPIGRWLANDVPALVRSSMLYERSKLRHAAFHRDAARVLAFAFARDPRAHAALAPGGFFAETARSLHETLDEWLAHAKA